MATTERVDFLITARDAASSIFKGVEGSLSSLSGAYGKLSGLAAAAGVGAALHELVTRTIDAERASARLDAVLNSTGRSAGITRGELEHMAESLKKATTFDDDDIKKGLTALLRFREVQGDVFRDAAKLGPDLASALGTDLTDAYVRLGRALQDPATGMRALREAGVKLDEQQLRLAKSLHDIGDIAGAQRIVMEALAKSVGGSAGAENAGLYGATTRTHKAIDELYKAIGRQTLGTGTLDAASAALTKMKDVVEHGNWLEKLALLGAPLSPGSLLYVLLSGNSRPIEMGATALQSFEAPLAAFGAGKAADEQRARLAHEEFLRTVNITQGPRARGVLEAETDLAGKRLQILDELHSQSLVSEERYYDQRRSLVQDKARAEVAFLTEEIGRVGAQLEGDPGLTVDDRARKIIELEQLERARAKAVADASQEIILSRLQEGRATQALTDQFTELNAKVAEAQGNFVAAGNNRFNVQNRELIKKITALPEASPERAKAEEDLAKLRGLDTDANRFRQTTEGADQALQRLQNRETEINAQVRSGQLTELGGMRQLSAARQESLVELTRIGEQLTAIAATSDDPRLLVAADTFNARLKELASTADLVGERLRGALVEPLTTFLDSLGDKTKSAGDHFKDMLRGIGTQLSHLANQQLSQLLVGSSSNGGSGLIGLVGNVFAGLFKPTAMGGRRAGGEPLLVGERGPELWIPDSAGTMIPNGGGLGGGTVIVNNYMTFGSDVDRGTLLSWGQQVKAETVAAVRDQRNRTGDTR